MKTTTLIDDRSTQTPRRKLRALGLIGGITLATVAAFVFFSDGDPEESRPAAPVSRAAAPIDETASDAGLPEVVEGRDALVQWIDLLEESLERIERHEGYTYSFVRRERLGSRLGKTEEILMKVRHQPFSVHAKWLSGDKGREVLYITGENNGDMLVKAGGWKGRLVPTLKVDPNGSLAMRSSRYPITRAGLKNSVLKIIENRRADLDMKPLPTCRLETRRVIGDRPAYRFQVEYAGPDASETYHRCEYHLDAESLMPVAIENHGWGEEPQADAPFDETTLVESYRYLEVDFETALTDADFDRKNPAYAFKR